MRWKDNWDWYLSVPLMNYLSPGMDHWCFSDTGMRSSFFLCSLILQQLEMISLLIYHNSTPYFTGLFWPSFIMKEFFKLFSVNLNQLRKSKGKQLLITYRNNLATRILPTIRGRREYFSCSLITSLILCQIPFHYTLYQRSFTS